jgi:hypothetical protein
VAKDPGSAAKLKATGHEKGQEGGMSAWSQLLSLVPQLLWFAFAVMAFYLLYPLATKLIQDGNISKLSIGVVQIELTKLSREHSDLVDVAKRDLISEGERSAITDRFAQLSEKTRGATVLWVDDYHPQQNAVCSSESINYPKM